MSELINEPASGRDRAQIKRARDATAKLIELQRAQREVVAERRKAVLALLDRGYSLSTVAAWLGVTKSAVQKMTAG
jgi:hypothetical protein